MENIDFDLVKNFLIDNMLEEDYYVTSDVSLKSGLEIKSPVLKDHKDTWNDIKNILSFCKDKASISSRVGSHIHIGSQILKNNENIINLIKLWSTYENIIYRFSAGEYYYMRKGWLDYCYPCNSFFRTIYNKYDKQEYNLFDVINSLKTDQILRGARYRGLNFTNYQSPIKTLEKNTIEIRTPNGTLEEIIWQNNINFFTKLIKYSTSNKFDNDILEKRLNKNINKILNGTYYDFIDYEGAIELSNLIFDNDLDKFNFLKQYFKDFNIKNNYQLTKTPKFIK